MFKKLQLKWKVNGLNVLLIIATFALGGSLCGIAARKIIAFIAMEKGPLWMFVYILLMTILWPICVIITSIPLGQFVFFRKYIFKIFNGLRRKSNLGHLPGEHVQTQEVGEKGALLPANKNEESHQRGKIAIFASGAGSNALEIIKHFEHHPYIQVALVVCNKPQAGVVQIAETYGIDRLLIEQEPFYLGHGYVDMLKEKGITHIVLAGFLWKIPPTLLHHWPERIINIHPALLPKYGGKGMYGIRVHEAVLAHKEKESGITIHLVDDVYDNGAIIHQSRCIISESDTPESLAQKIHVLEHRHYPEVIEAFINAKLTLNKPTSDPL